MQVKEKNCFKTKKISYGVLFLVNSVIFTIVFSGFIMPTFNSDTIYHSLYPQGDWKSFVTSGRYITAFINEFFYKIHFNTAIQTPITFVVSAVIYAWGLLLGQKAFYEMDDSLFGTEDRKSIFFITILMVINVLMLEPMMFIELGIIYALSFWASILSFVQLTKKRYVSAFIFAEVSVMLYQSHVMIGFIMYAGYVYIISRGRLSLKVFVEEIISGCIVVFAGIFNVASVKVLSYYNVIPGVSKTVSLEGGLDKLIMLGKSFGEIITDNYGLLPGKWILPLVIALNLGLGIYVLLKGKRYLDIFYYVALCFGMLIAPCLFGLLQPAVSIPPRIAFSVYTGIAMIFLITFSLLAGIQRKICAASAVVLLILESVMCNIISAEHRASNALDTEYANMVLHEIQEYEEETGIPIENIGVLHDTVCSEKYESIKYYAYCINRRAVIDGWADVYFLNLVSGREFNKTHENDDVIYEQYVEGRNWDVFDAEEQLIFDGNCLYWIIY